MKNPKLVNKYIKLALMLKNFNKNNNDIKGRGYDDLLNRFEQVEKELVEEGYNVPKLSFMYFNGRKLN